MTGERSILVGASGPAYGGATPRESRNQVGAAADRVAAATCTSADDVAQPVSVAAATIRASAGQRRRPPSVIAVPPLLVHRKGRQLPRRTQPEAGARTAIARVIVARAARASSSTGYDVQCASPARTTGT